MEENFARLSENPYSLHFGDLLIDVALIHQLSGNCRRNGVKRFQFWRFWCPLRENERILKARLNWVRMFKANICSNNTKTTIDSHKTTFNLRGIRIEEWIFYLNQLLTGRQTKELQSKRTLAEIHTQSIIQSNAIKYTLPRTSTIHGLPKWKCGSKNIILTFRKES